MEDTNNDGHDSKTQILVKPKRGSDKDDNNEEQLLIFQPNNGVSNNVQHPVV